MSYEPYCLWCNARHQQKPECAPSAISKEKTTMKAKLRQAVLEKHAAAMWEALSNWESPAWAVVQRIAAELSAIESL